MFYLVSNVVTKLWMSAHQIDEGRKRFSLELMYQLGKNGDIALLSGSILLPLSESDTAVLQAVNTQSGFCDTFFRFAGLPPFF